jgi:DNA mismatch repair protein MutS
MEQYHAVKAQYPGHLVLFRVGDFYETFGDDAKLLARELEVVLTARSPDTKGERTPMAGVPYHAVESYLGRLVRKGYKVALCDQVEDARFAKGLVRREVTRVVTPGTVIEERILPGPEHNFLAAVVLGSEGPGAVAAVDVTTGELFGGRADAPGLPALLLALAPFSPREILLPPVGEGGTAALRAAFRLEFPAARLEPAPEPASPPEWPELLGRARPGLEPELAEAVGRVVSYVRSTQPRLLPYLEHRPRAPGERRLRLDGKTLRHLEITRPMNLEEAGGPTLLSSWDETVTAPGRRTLGFWLRNPLADLGAIRERQETVAALLEVGAGLDRVRETLRRFSDLSRIATRLAGRRLRPPELGALRHSLEAVAELQALLAAPGVPERATELGRRLDPMREVAERLAAAIPDPPPATVEAGGLFRPGFGEEIDRCAADSREALAALEALERREAEGSGIRSLKIGYNQVFGYYFEVTRPHLARVPAHFRRKQTLSGAERFTTDELSDIESRLLRARDRSSEVELQAWEQFLVELEAQIPRLHRLCRAVGELDVLVDFARIARARGYVRPEVDDGPLLQIRDGRHPVLEGTLGERFVPNDTDLDLAGSRLLVLTGPNMSGKSTYMRQVGLLVLLAQVGAFLPAKYARVGMVSAMFTRMGFGDDISRGKSSFMVEMTEVSDILRAADERSLVLLDEVGRGTSTFDGLALAWAILKELHDRVRCRTILATHYHQLTELIATLDAARNAHFAVREDGRGVVFLHRMVPGSTDRSYGLHVAKLAGLPPGLLKEAGLLLQRLEAGGIAVRGGAPGRAAPVRYTQAILLPSGPGPEGPESEVLRAIARLDPERMTPIEALQHLAELRRRLPPPPGDRT